MRLGKGGAHRVAVGKRGVAAVPPPPAVRARAMEEEEREKDRLARGKECRGLRSKIFRFKC